MLRLVIAALIGLASFGVLAQAYDPQVAYVRPDGKGTALVLANQDGSGSFTVYRSKTGLSGVDFAPGGGRIAFSERGVLRVLAYTALPTGVTVDSVVTLDANLASEPDFSPDGSRILYVSGSTGTTQVRVIPAGGGASQVIDMGNMSGLTQVAWIGSSGSQFVYLRQFPSDLRYEVRQVTLDMWGGVVSDQSVLTTDGAPFGAISWLDVARTRNAVLVTLHYPAAARIVEYNLGTGVFTDYASGFNAHFSSDNGKIVHLDPSRSFVNSLDVASGSITRLTKKGSFSSVDASP